MSKDEKTIEHLVKKFRFLLFSYDPPDKDSLKPMPGKWNWINIK